MKFTIFLTGDCNLNCKYCYEGEKHKDYMSIATADKVIDFISNQINIASYMKNEKITIVLYGGEPLLNTKTLKYLINNLDSKIEKNIRYDLTTNGTILNDEALSILDQLGSISVSVDGGKKAHDFNRVFRSKKGSFDIVKGNIEKMLSKGISIRLRGTYTPETCNYLYESVKELVSLKTDCIALHPDLHNQNWTENHFEEIFSQFKKMCDNEEIIKNHDRISIIDTTDFCQEVGDCFGGVTEFSIYCDGTIYPCSKAVGEEEFIIGNVYDNHLNKDNINRLFTLHDEHNECSECTRKKFCLGNRCKIVNKLQTGDFLAPSGLNCKFQSLELKKYKYIEKLLHENKFLETNI